MSTCDPRISIMCDKCQCEEEFGMTKLAGDGWDDRNVPKEAMRIGWKVDAYDDKHLCPDCQEDETP